MAEKPDKEKQEKEKDYSNNPQERPLTEEETKEMLKKMSSSGGAKIVPLGKPTPEE